MHLLIWTCAQHGSFIFYTLECIRDNNHTIYFILYLIMGNFFHHSLNKFRDIFFVLKLISSFVKWLVIVKIPYQYLSSNSMVLYVSKFLIVDGTKQLSTDLLKYWGSQPLSPFLPFAESFTFSTSTAFSLHDENTETIITYIC